MSTISKIAASAAVLPMLAFSAPAFADVTVGQVEQGNIYRVRNVSTSASGTFSDNADAVCGNTVQFRVRIHNSGPNALTNVKVAATLDNQSATTHGSKVSVSADNALDNMVVTDTAGVTTDKATTISYVSGSTELLDYSATPGGEHVIKTLPDGIVGDGVNIGTVGPLTPDTEEVQFKATLNCEVTPPNHIKVCELSTKNIVTIKESDFDSAKYTKNLSLCNVTVTTPPTTLTNTGAGSVAAIFAGAAVVATAAYSWFLRRQNAR